MTTFQFKTDFVRLCLLETSVHVSTTYHTLLSIKSSLAGAVISFWITLLWASRLTWKACHRFSKLINWCFPFHSTVSLRPVPLWYTISNGSFRRVVSKRARWNTVTYYCMLVAYWLAVMDASVCWVTVRSCVIFSITCQVLPWVTSELGPRVGEGKEAGLTPKVAGVGRGVVVLLLADGWSQR